MNPEQFGATGGSEKDKQSGNKKQEKVAKGKHRLKLKHDTASEQSSGASNAVGTDDNLLVSPSLEEGQHFSSQGTSLRHRPRRTDSPFNTSSQGPLIPPLPRNSDEANQTGSSSRNFPCLRNFDQRPHRQPHHPFRNRATRLGHNHNNENSLPSSSSSRHHSPQRRTYSEKNASPRSAYPSVPDLPSLRSTTLADEGSDEDVEVFIRDDRSPSLSPHFTDFYSNLIRGLGSEEEPFEILSDSPRPSTTTVLSDEEIARQLQEEEWVTAGSSSSSPRNLFYNGIAPLRRQPSIPTRTLSDTGASRTFGLLDLGEHHSRRQTTRNDWAPSRLTRSSRRRPQLDPFGPIGMNFSDDIASLIFDLFHNYGMSDNEIESMLNPGVVGDPPVRGDYESLLALAERLGEVSRGLSEFEIKQIPTSMHCCDEDEEGAKAMPGSELPQCNICLTDYQHGEEMRNLPCRHNFHMVCVDQWLKINATCPVCRAEVKKSST
ncbi:hypothetical protein Btru_064810 [Bulinus truncatus]|nr:hypothetical protein Btru_064810 [Bulinus truncatus]